MSFALSLSSAAPPSQPKLAEPRKWTKSWLRAPESRCSERRSHLCSRAARKCLLFQGADFSTLLAGANRSGRRNRSRGRSCCSRCRRRHHLSPWQPHTRPGRFRPLARSLARVQSSPVQSSSARSARGSLLPPQTQALAEATGNNLLARQTA